MSDFITSAPVCGALDPEKRVNYTLGLVLGVDEFEQEQFYFLERDRQHNRALHGYGTICGLHLTTEGTNVIVGPGLALNPQGKVIRVPRPQCADLDSWLSVEANRQRIGQPGSDVALYVVLCYRECKTDKVPVPGAPCRAEDDTLAPARITETFELKLSLQPPAAIEEQAVRRFGRLLRRIRVESGGAGPFLTPAEMADLVRDLLHEEMLGSPLDSPLASPLEASPLWVLPADLEAVLRIAFHVWTTEVRPALLGDGKGCAGAPPDEDCILLGQVRFATTIDWKVAPALLPDDPPVLLIEDDRPILLHTRLLQEWLSHAAQGFEQNVGGDVSGHISNVTVEKIRNIDVAAILPADGQVLTFQDNLWQPADPPAGGVAPSPATTVADETTFGITPAVGTALEYAHADHTHGTPTLPDLNGDVTGDMTANTVAGIRNVVVAPTAPAAGQVLTFQGGIWQPADPPAVPSAPTPGTAVASETSFGLTSAVGTSSQYARADHTHGTPTLPDLNGDVTGGVTANTVTGIRNVGVAPTAPAAGQVLTFQGGVWQPANPPAVPTVPTPGTAVAGETSFGLTSAVGTSPQYARADHTHGTPSLPTLGGDVTGAVTGNTVTRIRNFTVQTPTAAQSGQVLTFLGNQWRVQPVSPAGGDFVEHPAGAGAYFIVAAGIVRGDGFQRMPVYNGLIARAISNNLVRIRFAGYRPPDDNFLYIVKAMAVDNFDNFKGPIITFSTFRADGIILSVRDLGAPLSQSNLEQLELMIEVSEYRRPS